MRVEKIGGTELPLDNDDPRREHERAESARELDRLNLSRERFRKDMGLSQEEYKKQTERARKLGFGALLKESTDELKKRNK